MEKMDLEDRKPRHKAAEPGSGKGSNSKKIDGEYVVGDLLLPIKPKEPTEKHKKIPLPPKPWAHKRDSEDDSTGLETPKNRPLKGS